MTQTIAISPLAPACFPELPQIEGIRIAVAAAGIKYQNRDDVMLLCADEGSSAAGVFTRSATASAAVDFSRQALATGKACAVLTNSGNANAFTGQKGAASVLHYRQGLADQLGCTAEHIMVASTGVIGEVLEADKMTGCYDSLYDALGKTSWQEAAHAICTTDTFAKGATAKLDINGVEVTINGIAKGSGMIAPDMATMLGYIATDAAISASCLQQMLQQATATSFNAITVDSDTSTSDSVYLFASHKAGHSLIDDIDSAEAQHFLDALTEVMTDLAIQIVRDGEGASKLITIDVSSARDDEDARRIALSIGNSPLVKTAIAGEDANWGRIVMAVGKSGAAVDRDRLAISIGGIVIARDGEAVEGYDEAPVARHMKGENIHIAVDIGVEEQGGSARIYSCDLTHGYISINADYRS